MGLFENDIYVFGLIIGIITLFLIWINNKRQKKGFIPDIKIIHHQAVGYRFPRGLDFSLKNNGLGLAKNIEVKPESEIGDFKVSEHEKELFPQQVPIIINLDWKVDPIPRNYEGDVKVKVSYESILKRYIFFKDKKTHKIEYHIKDGKVTLLKDGN
jgi:hypothetical protein